MAGEGQAAVAAVGVEIAQGGVRRVARGGIGRGDAQEWGSALLLSECRQCPRQLPHGSAPFRAPGGLHLRSPEGRNIDDWNSPNLPQAQEIGVRAHQVIG